MESEEKVAHFWNKFSNFYFAVNCDSDWPNAS